jgi:hypothetical protein
MSTTLKAPGIDLTADILAMSAALGGEASDKITSAWTALGLVRDLCVLGMATNIVQTQIVTLVIRTASSAAGAGSATLTPKTETAVATATGTATAADKFLLVGEAVNIPAGHTHIQAELSTDDTDGTEIVSLLLLRKVNAQN